MYVTASLCGPPAPFRFQLPVDAALFLDPEIRVDRHEKLAYHGRRNSLAHPGLACLGPGHYSLADLEPWLHEGQAGDGSVTGDALFKHLKDSLLLGRCLSLADGLAIRKKDIRIVRHYFGGNSIPLWRSVIGEVGTGERLVPVLEADDPDSDSGDPVSWVYLDGDFCSCCPAYLLPK